MTVVFRFQVCIMLKRGKKFLTFAAALHIVFGEIFPLQEIGIADQPEITEYLCGMLLHMHAGDRTSRANRGGNLLEGRIFRKYDGISGPEPQLLMKSYAISEP